jgi:ectoine hydroxylase-related dioxygenase (phytanoyl-CoA dioxygenase family)
MNAPCGLRSPYGVFVYRDAVAKASKSFPQALPAFLVLLSRSRRLSLVRGTMIRFINYAGMITNRYESSVDTHVENLAIRGVSVATGVLTADECVKWAERLDRLDAAQIQRYGMERLEQLNERGAVRGMLHDDADFLVLVRHPATWPVIERILGATAILHLQNGIIVEPGLEHHQSSFHRDFAKDFVAHKPLSVNAFFMIDDFTAASGATWWVPHTHRIPAVPSASYLETEAVQIEAPAGSVVFFDSMLIHRSGQNRSPIRRRAINHQYTRPFIKQQLDYPSLLRGRVDPESVLAQTLGFWAVPPKSVDEFRVDPEQRTYRQGQG